MADVAISGLTALGGAPATNDLLVEVDVSDTTQAPTGTTKKMTVANLFTSPTMTTVTISSGGLTVTLGGLAVSAGTTAVQALTATTGVFSSTVSAASLTAAAAGAHAWTGRSQMSSPADGVIQILNAGATAASRLVIGGTTTGFPSIRANGAVLEVRLGDDSAYAVCGASSYQVNGTQVVGARSTGWTAQTETGAKGNFGGTGAYTLTNIGQWASAIQAALTAHGILGT